MSYSLALVYASFSNRPSDKSMLLIGMPCLCAQHAVKTSSNMRHMSQLQTLFHAASCEHKRYVQKHEHFLQVAWTGW